MMKEDKKSGFSLLESMISLMILSLVVMLTLASITKKKTTPKTRTTITGMYACWYDDSGTLRQEQYDGHAAKVGIDRTPSHCQFEMDRRAYKYYAVAVGSRKCTSSGCINGQMKQAVIPSPIGDVESEMSLQINLGRIGAGEAGVTEITQDGYTLLSAMGGMSATTSGLIPGNIKGCRVASGTPCAADETPTCMVATSENQYFNGSGNNFYKTNIIVNCVNSTGMANNDNSCQMNASNMNKSVSGNKILYTGNCIKPDGSSASNIYIDVQQEDSGLGSGANALYDSSFTKYLKMIPHSMQNGLTDTLLGYYQSGTQKGGVVLIIW